jgi:hypothetical protein
MANYKKLISELLEEQAAQTDGDLERWMSNRGISLDDLVPLGESFLKGLPPDSAQVALSLSLTGFYIGFEAARRTERKKS